MKVRPLWLKTIYASAIVYVFFAEYINPELHVSRQVYFPTSLNPTSKWIVCHALERGRSGIYPSGVELRLAQVGLVYSG